MTIRIATAAGAGADTRYFVPFTKVEENADGSVYVEGVATGEILDFHGEVVSYEASKAAFEEWSAWAEKATDGQSIGNIRVMHQPIVAGRAVKWWADDATRQIFLGSRIDDPVQAKLCRTRAYTGYSIGGNDVVREMGEWDGRPAPWITSYRLSENSLVDKPACPTATFTLVKRFTEQTERSTMNKIIEILRIGVIAKIQQAMPDKDTIKIGEQTISIAGTPEIPMLEMRKDAASAVVAGGEALDALKKFLVEVLGMDGDPDMWTIGDVCEAMRYCYSARLGAQYQVGENAGDVAIAAAATADTLTKSDTPADPPKDDEEKPVDPKEEVDPAKAPEPVPAVPPVAAEPEKQAGVDLGPLLKAIAKLEELVAPLVKALQEGSLTKVAGRETTVVIQEAFADAPAIKLLAEKVEAIKVLAADVPAIKKAIEQLPAPPPGRAVNKSIGALTAGDGEVTPETMEKAVELLEATGRLEHVDRVKLRTALATATIQLGGSR